MSPAEALDKAIEIVGSMKRLGDQLDVTKGAIGQWKKPGRQVPAEHCPTIERITNHSVICEELRPDVEWQVLRSWPSPLKYGRRQTDRKT